MGDGAMCHYCRKYQCICPEPVVKVRCPYCREGVLDLRELKLHLLASCKAWDETRLPTDRG